MMTKRALILVLILSFGACHQEKGIAFKITNNSGATVTDVTFSTSENKESISFDSLGEGQNVEDFLIMKDNEVDGSYTLEYVMANEFVVKKSFGYYTNGSPTDEWLRIEIKKDTTIVKFGEFAKD